MQNKSTHHELLEAWDWETGRPTGARIERDRAHREGIPHESVHLWIVRNVQENPEILFQHRAPHKELYPDCLDITAAGHVPYGFRGNKILKEADEEIGISPDDSDLIDLGWYRYEERNNRFHHRELQHVFMLRDDRPLDRYHFKDKEVCGIYAVTIKGLGEILAGNISIPARGFNGRECIQKSVSRRDFHSQLFDPSMEQYMEMVLKAAHELATKGRITTFMPESV